MVNLKSRTESYSLSLSSSRVKDSRMRIQSTERNFSSWKIKTLIWSESTSDALEKSTQHGSLSRQSSITWPEVWSRSKLVRSSQIYGKSRQVCAGLAKVLSRLIRPTSSLSCVIRMVTARSHTTNWPHSTTVSCARQFAMNSLASSSRNLRKTKSLEEPARVPTC